MNPRKLTLSLAALVAAPLLFAFGPRDDALTFQPKAGTSVERELTLTGSMYIDDLVFSADGEEIPAEMFGEVLDMAFEVELAEETTDEFVKSSDGRPLILLRTFNELSATMSAGGESESPDDSDLVDDTVKFTWNEEEEEYDITLEDGDSDEEDIESLDVDMDFICLLPDEEVKEGSSWEVAGKSVQSMFLPGGAAGGGEDVPEEMTELSEAAEDLLKPQLEDALEDFVIECTYKGKDEDGNALIEFEYEGELSLDFSELMSQAMEMQEVGVEFEADVTLNMDIELEGSGTLTWDIEAGHTRAFEMTLEVVILVDGAADIEAAGESHTAEATIELSGEMEYEMTVE